MKRKNLQQKLEKKSFIGYFVMQEQIKHKQVSIVSFINKGDDKYRLIDDDLRFDE